MKEIIKLLSIIAILSAALPSSAASSPAATQSWVSNYVAKAMATAVTDELPTNCAAADVDTSGNLCFTYNGVDYSYHVTVTNRAADVEAYRVYSSTSPSAVPVGTVFASDGSGNYVNDGIAFPNALRLTVTNDVRHLDQSNGVWVAESSGTTNSVFVNVSSNGVCSFSLKLSKFTVTESEARSIGVTNFITAAFGPVKTDFLDVVREIFFGSAYADDLASGGSSAASFEYLVTYDNLADGVVRTVSVLFTYGYEFHDWNVYPEDPHPAADDEHYYVPNSWPYSSEWSLASNWKAAGTGDKIYLTSYVDNAGVMDEITIAVKLSRLEKLGNKTLSECIPPFTPPQYLEREKSDLCNRNNHYWVHCVCRDCGEEKDHNLVRKDGSATCNRCDNYQGRASSHLSELCGSTKSHGDVKSSIGNHYGWHDSDGVYGNMMACTCECGDWTTVHAPSGTKSDIGEGYYDIEQGITLPNTDEEYHHFSMQCNASKGDGTDCSADVVYNEAHDYKAADGSAPHPIVGDKNDEENVIHLSHGEQSDAANEEYHYAQGMECTVCHRKSDKYDDHAFPSQASGIEACTCEGCGLIVHRQDGGWACGTKEVPGCKTCKTYSKTGSRWKDRISNLTEDLHDYRSAGAPLTETTHTCVCGLSTFNHCFVKKDGTTWVCKVCGYEYEGEGGDEPPEYLRRDYVVSGFCGNWIKRDGTVFAGGNDKLSDGTEAYFPTDHNFDCLTLFPELLCYQCVNVSPLDGLYCAHFSNDDIKKHGGWHDISNRCHCVCGMFEQDHRMEASGDGSVYRFSTGPSNECLKVGKCDNIGPNTSYDDYCHADVSNEVDHAFFIATNNVCTFESATNHFVRLVCMHEFETLNREHPGCGLVTNELFSHCYVVTNVPPPFMVDSTNHAVSIVCVADENGYPGCGNVTNELEQHEMSDLEWIKTETNCMAYFRCEDDCGYTNAVLELAHHVASGNDANRTYATVSNCYHVIYDRCVRECEDVVCNRKFAVGTAHCEAYASGAAAITLTNDPSAKDFYPCRYCKTGHAAELSHCWHYNSERHWCRQLAADEDHLRGDHVMVNNKCTVCGYSPGGSSDDEYKTVPIEVSCRGLCGCYNGAYSYHRMWRTNGVEIAESERGEWIFDGITYPTEWSTCHYDVDGECKCPYCSGESDLVYNECYCPHISSGDLLKFTDAIITGSYHLRYAGTGYKIVSFIDPVYSIGDYCFDEAFVSMPNLLAVNASTVTNVGACAFRYAFTNDTNLSSVLFNGLSVAGSSAFKGAFRGCPLNGTVSFSRLKECGGGCFEGAFEETRLESLTLSSLVDPNGSLNLFGGTVCASMVSLSAPKLDFAPTQYQPVFSFAHMPNLAYLNLSGVSTNVFNLIGDLSSMSKLARIDLHEMAGVPNYYQIGTYGENAGRHAPTNNPNCMIVVPDGLWKSWCEAPGWSTIAGQIVPYSNQVIRPIVSVTFVYDNGTADSVTNIVVGTGVTPPTDIVRFAAESGGYADGAYSFAGWYTDAAKTVPYVAGTAIDGSTTLYAKWNDSSLIQTDGEDYTTIHPPDSSAVQDNVIVGIASERIGLDHETYNFNIRLVCVYTSDGAAVTNRFSVDTQGDPWNLSYTLDASVPASVFFPATAWLELTNEGTSLPPFAIRSNEFTVRRQD